jgi:hypothetical protein
VKLLLRPVSPRALWWLAPALLALALPAQAQNYRCSSAKGTYYSDRPCPIDGGTRLGGFGPAVQPEAPPAYNYRPPPPVQRAPEHLSYMSAECASLNDGLRTAASRGLSLSTQSDLRNDYARRCSAEESLARQRWSKDQFKDKLGRREDERQAAQQARRDQVEQQQTTSGCSEMRRIIANKNERLATLTPGEVADLRRFETNYTARCVNRTQ